MQTGKVKFFDDMKGFGFIETGASEDDVFFHMDDITGAQPREGDELKFEITEGPKGLRAENIERV